MKAKDYKAKFLHLMAEGYSAEDALMQIASDFLQEYREMAAKKSGSEIANCMREQFDKWKAFARLLPNYPIKEDGFSEAVKLIRPELIAAYDGYRKSIRMLVNAKNLAKLGETNGRRNL